MCGTKRRMRHTDNILSGFWGSARNGIASTKSENALSNEYNIEALQQEKPSGYDEHYEEVEARYGKPERTTYWPVVDALKCKL